MQVAELFNAMRDQCKDGNSGAANNGRSLSGGATLTSLCADISPSSSHFFEVCMLVLIISLYSFIKQFHHNAVILQCNMANLLII
jgi:hypothetical protein